LRRDAGGGAHDQVFACFVEQHDRTHGVGQHGLGQQAQLIEDLVGTVVTGDHLQDVALQLQQLFEPLVAYLCPLVGQIFVFDGSHSRESFPELFVGYRPETTKYKYQDGVGVGVPINPDPCQKSGDKKANHVAGLAESCSFSVATVPVALSPMPMPSTGEVFAYQRSESVTDPDP
jgi:hypothetical protein